MNILNINGSHEQKLCWQKDVMLLKLVLYPDLTIIHILSEVLNKKLVYHRENIKRN